MEGNPSGFRIFFESDFVEGNCKRFAFAVFVLPIAIGTGALYQPQVIPDLPAEELQMLRICGFA